MLFKHTLLRSLLNRILPLIISILFLILIGVSCSDEIGAGQAGSIEISKIKPDSGRVGTQVQIYSNSIAPQLNSNKVYFNDIPAEVKQYDRQKVIARVPEGATSGPVRLEVNEYTANGPYFTVKNEGPSIDNIAPKKGGPGTKITISGENFLTPSMLNSLSADADTSNVSSSSGSAKGDFDLNSINEKINSTSVIQALPVSVQFGNVQAPILSISSTEIVVMIPEEAVDKTIRVTVGEFTATSTNFDLFPIPVIDNVNPKTGPIGTPVTINGFYFSSQADSNIISFNGSPARISNADSTKLIAIVPNDATNGPIQITTNGQSVEGPTFTVTKAPVPQLEINNIAPKTGPTGTVVEIKGSNFSVDPAINVVRFNGTKAAINEASKSRLEVTVPTGATNGPVSVTNGDQTATGPNFTVTADSDKQLTIGNIAPKQGPVSTSVTVTGDNFSTSSSENIVTFNGAKATVTSATKTQLEVTVPQEATTGPVKVQVGTNSATGPTFTLTDAPLPDVKIDDINPKSGTISSSVTITGSNFSSIPAENTVTFNGTKTTISKASKTELIATVPQGATTGPVEVQVNGQADTGPTFTITETPVPEVSIDDISPKSGPVGTTVTITGDNFSTSNSNNTVSFNGTKASISSVSETELVATVPQGATNGPVTVADGNQIAQGPSFTVIADPDQQLSIDNISPKEGPEGTVVTITGANFSASAGDNAVTFNGSQASVSNASTTELVATVPDGATSGPVTVKVGDQSATGPTFTVGNNAAPTITGEGSFTIEENTTEVTTITASDPDGDELTFSLSGGADQGAFNIDNDSGVLSFAAAPDFDNPGDADTDNSYEVEAGVSDGSVTVTKTLTITLTNVDEAPVITSNSSFGIDENNTDAGTVAATDPEGTGVAFSLSGGTDQGSLSIDPNSGGLTLDAAPDFESPADANGDNKYQAEVTISDGNQSTTQAVTITVQDVNEAPVITSTGSFTTEENTPSAGTITATDPDGDALDFALLGGTKGTLTFRIDASTGKITISPAPDFENPRDDNGDNTYEVDINVNDGSLGTSQTVSITVTNVVEVPTINRGTIGLSNTQNFSLNETTEKNVYRFDPVPAGTDLSSIQQFSLATSLLTDLPTSASVTGGADGGLFSVSGLNVYAIYIDGPSSLDYNHSADGNAHEYRFTINATNAAGTTPEYTIIIPVTPFAGGSGTAADPYQVENIGQLQAVDQFLGAHFEQTADIDAAATASWNSGQGFEPIGTLDNRFSGSYNGQGFEISNLTIDRPNSTIQGLFGTAATGAILENIVLTGANVSAYGGSGVLAGYNRGVIDNSIATGTIGYPNSVSRFELIFIGGLVGYNGKTPLADSKPSSGKIINSQSEVNVTGGHTVGGLVGYNSAPITNSSASGSIAGAVSGGLVGSNSSNITDSNASGFTRGASSSGGLVGLSFPGSYIASSWATGDIADTGSKGGDGGGLVGEFSGTIVDSWASGNVNITEGAAGGLVGSSSDSSGTINRSFATGSASSANCSSGIGGLIGYVAPNTTIKNSYATGNATYTEWRGCGTTSYVGGFAGKNLGTIRKSYAVGIVRGYDRKFVLGGFTGTLNGFHGDVGTVINNYYDTQTTDQNSSAGGTGLTTSQMQGSAVQTNMIGFDFNNVWQINSRDYPTLLSNPEN